MEIEIRKIEPTKKNLLEFAHFPIDILYKNNPYYVPDLVTDIVDTLRPDKNPAFELCQAAYFMAYDGKKPVGRVAAIINTVVNKRNNRDEVRFGFIDFIDDAEVADGLIKAVEEWGTARGMKYITGPLGFTDMDAEGCLIEGFDQLSTQATIYNAPYYQKHFERMGFVKDADWVEFKVTIPKKIPEKMVRVADIVKSRYKLKTIRFTSRKRLVKTYGEAIFALINKAYDSLFGYSPLTEAQIQHYIDIYLPFLPLDHVSLIVKEEDETLIGFGISIPSLSQALIKGRGRLFPTGWFHLLRAIQGHTHIVDLMLIAVEPEYQNKGVNSLLFTDLLPVFIKRGYKWAETNVELESNQKVQSQWQYFETEQHKRRRAYTREIK